MEERTHHHDQKIFAECFPPVLPTDLHKYLSESFNLLLRSIANVLGLDGLFSLSVGSVSVSCHFLAASFDFGARSSDSASLQRHDVFQSQNIELMLIFISESKTK